MIARIVGVASVLTAAAAPARAQNLVHFGDTITDPGVYVLAGNQSGMGTGVEIASDDVVLLLLRFTLRNVEPPPPVAGEALAVPVGILVVGHDNVTIWGGRVTNFFFGIEFLNCTECTVRDTRVDDSFQHGILASGLEHSAFVRVRTNDNGGHGISLVNSSYNRFFSVLSDGNGRDGIFLGGGQVLAGLGSEPGAATDNRFKKCWFAYNHANGLELEDADRNTIEENQCVANERAGILLGPLPEPTFGTDPSGGPGSDDNEVRKNWCPFNGIGIAVGVGSTDNELTENIALASSVFDAFEGNPAPPCVNTWFLNTVLFRGGPGAVCIF